MTTKEEELKHGQRIRHCWPGWARAPNHTSDSDHLRGILDCEEGGRLGAGGLQKASQ